MMLQFVNIMIDISISISISIIRILLIIIHSYFRLVGTTKTTTLMITWSFHNTIVVLLFISHD